MDDNYGITENEWYHETGSIPTVAQAAAILADLPRNASRALKLAIVKMAGVRCSDFRTEIKKDWRLEGF